MVLTYVIIAFLAGALFSGVFVYLWREIQRLKTELAQVKTGRLTYNQVDGTEHAIALGLKVQRDLHTLNELINHQAELVGSAADELETLQAIQRLLRESPHAYDEAKIKSKKNPVKLW